MHGTQFVENYDNMLLADKTNIELSTCIDVPNCGQPYMATV